MKKNIINSILFLVSISLFMFLVSCERPETDIPTDHTTIDNEIEAGWDAYADGDYSSAYDHFTVAALRDVAKAEAYSGIGWSALKLGMYSEATSQFSFVINLAAEQGLTTFQADAYAALSLINDSQRFEAELNEEDAEIIDAYVDASILAGQRAVTINSSYSNVHNPNYAATEVHKMIAHNYFYKHWYTAALSHLGSSTGFDYTQESMVTSTQKVMFSPVLDSEAGTLIASPVTITWADTVNGIPSNYVDGTAVVSIVDLENIVDANDAATTASIHVLDGNSILFDGIEEFGYPEIVETVTSLVINYPLDGGAAVPLTLLKLNKGGVFEVTDIQEWAPVYYDVYLPDGTTRIDTVMEKDAYEGTVEIFDFADGFPAAIQPTFRDDFKFNYVYLPQKNKGGTVFEITYKYAYYEADIVTTNDFSKYLGILSQQFD
ncbi:MAG: hypothetical protein K9N35_10575 [Candidatus Marinimicrobia bacterium]|nr:hypothetical protein [Candidatus Neomarinimicrobiota bacterium]